MLSKEHYCCKINKLFIDEKQCFPSTLKSIINREWGMGGGWDGEGGYSHCKRCANDITSYSKNNVIFLYKQTIPISPFVQPLLCSISLFIDCFTSLPL